MSHFAVLVIGDDVEKQLAPYDENTATAFFGTTAAGQDARWDWWRVGGRFSGLLPLISGGTADTALLQDIDTQAIKPPFAWVRDAEWHEKGRMGWWADVADEKDDADWDREFTAMLNTVTGDTRLTVVDCHI